MIAFSDMTETTGAPLISWAGIDPATVEPGMPPEQPGKMELQSFQSFDPSTRRQFINPQSRSKIWRRLCIFGGILALTGFAIEEMREVLSVNGLTPVEWVVLFFFTITFSWIALAFVSAIFGALQLIMRLFREPQRSSKPLIGRTAVLIPSYNEDTSRIFSGIEAMASAVHALGEGHSFDWVVLADTTDPDIALMEEAALVHARARLGSKGKVYYRRRRQNIAKKVGNVTDFLRRWGNLYDHVLVLDADSTMEAETIIELARRMEADPDAGLIQTIPMLVNGTTVFARLQQFAGRVYGPVVGTGLAWWAQSEGNFWGHNAIVRTSAFMSAAGLPDLKGKPPFGGHVMSHDFVEAALLRRAGWTVRIADDLRGSYEESPPSIIDMAIRDRRWCQGNLQHSKIIGAKGLYWPNRMHMAVGIMSYLSSPLWLMLILSGLALTLQAHFIRPEYFTQRFSLFPTWPVIDPIKSLTLFAMTMVVLFGPKVLGIITFLCDSKARRAAGGALWVLVGVILEVVLSALIAPVMMFAQTGAVVSILSGFDGGWKPQRRDDGALPWRDLWRQHRFHTFMGLLLLLAAYADSLALVAWLSPAIIGLIIAVPVSGFTSALGIGRAFKAIGFMSIPEESEPPQIILDARALRGVYESALKSSPQMVDVLENPTARRTHLMLVDRIQERQRGKVDPIDAMVRAKVAEAESIVEALSFLDRKEQSWLIATPLLIAEIARLARNQPLSTPPLTVAGARSPVEVESSSPAGPHGPWVEGLTAMSQPDMPPAIGYHMAAPPTLQLGEQLSG